MVHLDAQLLHLSLESRTPVDGRNLTNGHERMPRLLFQKLSPVTDQENPHCGQQEQHQIGPIELLIDHRGREEVAEHDHENDAGDYLNQNLESQKVIRLMGQGVQIGVNSSQNIQLKL